jgi:hypothetical protein
MRPAAPLPAVIGKLISYEVAIIELIEPAGSSTVPDLSALEKAGKLHSLTRLQLSSAEEQPAFIQFGSLTPRTTGRVATGATVMPIYSDVNLGMIAQVTGRVQDDGAIIAQVYVERSALVGDEEPFNPQVNTPPIPIDRVLTNATVRLTPGQPQLIGGRQVSMGSEATRTWIFLTAQAGGGPAKTAAGTQLK